MRGNFVALFVYPPDDVGMRARHPTEAEERCPLMFRGQEAEDSVDICVYPGLKALPPVLCSRCVDVENVEPFLYVKGEYFHGTK
jgi:hypothetical protein